MPSRERVLALVKMVEEGRYIDALREFYLEDASMQENGEVVIRWVIEFTRRDGTSFRMDELAHQRWRGDRVAEERFYYDPEQLRRRS